MLDFTTWLGSLFILIALQIIHVEICALVDWRVCVVQSLWWAGSDVKQFAGKPQIQAQGCKHQLVILIIIGTSHLAMQIEEIACIRCSLISSW